MPFVRGTSSTPAAAQLTKPGGLDSDAGNGLSCVDEYTAWLAPGQARPIVGGTAANVSGIPALGSLHTVYTTLSVSRVAWSQPDPTSSVWVATVSYSDGTDESDPESSTPDRRLVSESWDVRRVTADLVNDAITGAPIINSAGDPFDSMPQTERVSPVVRIVRRENHSAAHYAAYNGRVNSAAVTIGGISFAKHCARVSITGEKITDSRFSHEITFLVEGATNPVKLTPNSSTTDIGWDVAILNCGYRFLADGEPVRYQVKASDGTLQDSPTPAPLASDGSIAAASAAIFLRFSPYAEIAFSGLKLPTT